MRYLTVLSNYNYSRLRAYILEESVYVVPLDTPIRDFLQDILYTDWGRGAAVAVICEIDDKEVTRFAYPTMSTTDLKNHYTGYLYSGYSMRILDTFKLEVDGWMDAFATVNFKNFLAKYKCDALLYTIIPFSSLDAIVQNRIVSLRQSSTERSNIEAVNDLLDLILTFCILNKADEECLKWCKENAPSALKFYKDGEIITAMSEAWLYHVEHDT